MNNKPSARPVRALISVAADNGAILGLYLLLLAIFAGLSTHFGLASLLVWVGSIYLPFFLYGMMRSHHADSSFGLSVPELWALASVSFMFAALIQAAGVYALLRWAVPTFLTDQVQTAIDTFAAMGTAEGDMWADTLTRLRLANGVPTAADMTANLIVFNILCGAAIGLIDAIVLSIRYRSPRRCDEYRRRCHRPQNNA